MYTCSRRDVKTVESLDGNEVVFTGQSVNLHVQSSRLRLKNNPEYFRTLRNRSSTAHSLRCHKTQKYVRDQGITKMKQIFRREHLFLFETSKMTQERLHSDKVNAYDVSVLDCVQTSIVCTSTLSKKSKEVNKELYSTTKPRF